MTTTTGDLTETHREIQALVREFAQAEIAPHSAEWNEAHHVPVEVLRTMAELGFLGVIIPEEYGGAGLDYTSLVLIIEEVAAADAGTSTGVAVQNCLGAAPILRAGTDEQKRRLPAGPRVAASASPPTRSPSPTPAPTPPTSAPPPAPDGDGWVVDGAKQWITSGGFADLFVVFARTGGPGPKGSRASWPSPAPASPWAPRWPRWACTPRRPSGSPSTATGWRPTA